jgi:hypothetical protein
MATLPQPVSATPIDPSSQLSNLYAQAQQQQNAYNQWLTPIVQKSLNTFNDRGAFGAVDPNAVNTLQNYGAALGGAASGYTGDATPEALQALQAAGINPANKLASFNGLLDAYNSIANDPNQMKSFASQLQQNPNYNPFAVDYSGLQKQYGAAFDQFNNQIAGLTGAGAQSKQAIAEGQAVNDKKQADYAAANQSVLDNWMKTTKAAGNPAIDEGFTRSIGALDTWKTNTQTKNDTAVKALDTQFNTNKTKLDTWLADNKKKYDPTELQTQFDSSYSKLRDWFNTNKAKYNNDPRITSAYNDQLNKLNTQFNQAKANAKTLLPQLQKQYDTQMAALNSNYTTAKAKTDQSAKIKSNYESQLATLNKAKATALANWQKKLDDTYKERQGQVNQQNSIFNASLNDSYNRNFYDQQARVQAGVDAYLKKLGMK